MTMKKNRLILALGMASLLAVTASEAQATPISGEIFFTGTGALKLGAADSTAPLADGIDFSNPVAIEEAISTGDYAGLPAATTATFTDLTGASAFGVQGTIGAFAVSPFWTFSVGPAVYTFELASRTFNGMAGSARVVEGWGTATITGVGSYDPTPGFWQLSTSGNSTMISFSSYAAVPDGGTTVALLGLAVLGLGAVRRRLNP